MTHKERIIKELEKQEALNLFKSVSIKEDYQKQIDIDKAKLHKYIIEVAKLENEVKRLEKENNRLTKILTNEVLYS